MQNDTISERLELTLGNIKHQQNLVLWDDLEKLEEVLERVQELEKQNEFLKAKILNLKYKIPIRTNLI
jgi:hypothetical protein